LLSSKRARQWWGHKAQQVKTVKKDHRDRLASQDRLGLRDQSGSVV
jgi:hypothetical protein